MLVYTMSLNRVQGFDTGIPHPAEGVPRTCMVKGFHAFFWLYLHGGGLRGFHGFVW